MTYLITKDELDDMLDRLSKSTASFIKEEMRPLEKRIKTLEKDLRDRQEMKMLEELIDKKRREKRKQRKDED